MAVVLIAAGLVSSCSGAAAAGAWDSLALTVKPELPLTLAAWNKRIVWRVTGSLLPGKTGLVGSGGALALPAGVFSPQGDWLLAEALLADDQAAGPAMPALGWTSARLAEDGGPATGPMELAVDWPRGCAAWLLGRVEAAGGSWRGLNLAKLERELAEKGLDSVSIDLWDAYGALVSGDISAWDLKALPTVAARIPAPPGEWLDCRGAPVPQDGSGWLKAEAPVGTGVLFRSDAGAYLRFTVRVGGDGEPQVEAAEHVYVE